MRAALLLALLPALAFAQPDPPRELAVNGAFDTDANHDGFPDGFGGDHTGVSLLTEDGNPFVRLANPGPAPASRSLGQQLKLDSDWFKLRVSVKVRLKGIVQGVEGWHDARVAMDFHSADGTQVGGWPNVLHWAGASDGWQSFSRDYVIPEHAVELRLSLSMFQCIGQVDFDGFSVRLIARRPKPEDAVLPVGVTADWSLEHAWREETPARGRVCLNGLWRFFPVMPGSAAGRPVDGTGWGWLKVPAAWPGRRNECVTPIGPDIWDLNVDWAKVEEGWYERRFTVPAEWAGRRVVVRFDMPQTAAEIAVDGKPAGTVRWPAGQVDVTALVAPGATATLTVHVTTDPFAKERMVAMREDLIEQVKAQVLFRGLVGDVYLASEPAAARLSAVQTRPSVRRKALGLAVRPQDLQPAARYRLEAVAVLDGQEAWRRTGPEFGAGDVKDGRYTCELPWPGPKLWDFEQPNLYDLTVSLVPSAGGPALDAVPLRFGFRELWLDGRNLLLNGTPVHLRALDFSGTSHNNAQASFAAVKRILGKMRSMGFNFIILANYGLEPGETCAFTDLLRAADEMGFALSFSGPHAFQNAGSGTTLSADWQASARYSVEVAGTHPSVLAYALNHNTLGYHGDQNPDKIDGLKDVEPNPADKGWPAQGWDERRARAAASEAFFRALDPTREVYHHQSGNCGSWHTVNIYLNWAPVQERSEWLRHWSSAGVKPLFFVEWGPPHAASWGGHRQGPFIWTNKVNSEPLAVEYGAMLTGDAAYRADPAMAQYVDTYERVYARKQPFHISEVFGPAWAASNELNYIALKSLYIRHNWPRLRTWGITAILPWDQGDVGYQSGPHPDRFDRKTDWNKLQQPGYAPDFESFTGDWFHHPANIWLLSSLGEAYMRYNQPICAYLGGGPENFTDASHTVVAGERVGKQAILLNDTRQPLEATYRWSLSAAGKAVASGDGRLTASPGGQARGPFAFRVPAGATGGLTLALDVTAGAQTQHDELALHVVQTTKPAAGLLAVFDPPGSTIATLKRLGVRATPVEADTPLDRFDALLIGRRAIRLDNRLPDLRPLLDRGRRVLVMEQTEPALTERLGFRVNDPSLRQVFVRVPAHPVLAGLDTDRLHDWRGEASLLAGKLDLPDWEPSDPPHDWLGFANTRVWKCGSTGQVATVVIEKPQRGDFAALVDGGFDLEYAPLLLHRAGAGQVLFCQMDVTARSVHDPAADRLHANLLTWVSAAADKPAAAPARYVGDDAGAALLTRLGVAFRRVEPLEAAGPGLLIAGPGCGGKLAGVAQAVGGAVRAGGELFCLPLPAEDLTTWLPAKVETTEATLLAASAAGDLTGIGPSELHWRGRKKVLQVAVAGGQPAVVSRVKLDKGAVTFCQIGPADWDYDDPYRIYLKRTADRTAALLARLLADAGAAFAGPLLTDWSTPVPPPVDLAGPWQAAPDADGSLTLETLEQARRWWTLQTPGLWEDQVAEAKGYDGVVWYRRTFEWRGPTDQPAALRLGAVDDEDWTYLNGKLVGHTGQDTHPDDYWSRDRSYALPAGSLRLGTNTLVVKVNDLRQGGGIACGPLQVVLPARWLASYYLDVPAQLDDPYRYNRW